MITSLTYLCDVALLRQKLCAEHSPAGSSSYGVMGQAHEFPVIDRILPEASDGYAHSLSEVHIQSHLGTVILLHVLDELLRCAGKV